jgi:pimeloyl-ACP methyl ester carboxylesterase
VRLLLLPGLDGSGQLFRRLIEHLPESIEPRVVSYPPDLFSYLTLLPIVRSAYPAGEPFLILAESFSGPLAVMAAAERPEGLAGLILAASFARSPCPRWVSHFGWLAREPLLRWAPPALALRALLGRGQRSTALAAEVRDAISGSAVLAVRFREVLRVDVTTQLRQLEVPLLYLAGSRDSVVGRSPLSLIQRYARRVQVVTLDTPHLLLQVAPEAAAREISKFAAHAVAF